MSARGKGVAGGVLAAIAIAWAAALAYSAAIGRVLYGDGALYVLVNLLNPHRFNDYDFQRTFASVISQAPVLLGEKLGLQSVASYAALYGFGIYAIPAIAMLAALWLSRRQPVLFIANAAAAVVYGFGTNFINTEANLLFGLVWLAATIIALALPSPMLRSVALPLIGVALLRCYEGMLLAGPVLAAWAVLAMRRAAFAEERAGFALAAVLFVLGAAIGLGGFLAPRDPGNAQAFAAAALAYLRAPQGLLLASCAACAAAAITPRLRWQRALAAAGALLGVAYVIAIARLDGYYGFTVYYGNRAFMVLLLPVLLMVLAVLAWRRPAWLEARVVPGAPAVVLVPFLFAVAGDLVGSYRWQSYVQAFCKVLDEDLPPAERMRRLRQSGVRTGWAWTHPTLSVLLRDRGTSAMVSNEPGGRWEPQEPFSAQAFGYEGLCQSPLLGASRGDSWAVPVSFKAGRYPSYVASVTGFSKPEGWATWTDGPRAIVRMDRRLPEAFELRLRIGAAFGENLGAPIRVRAGGVEREFTVRTQPEDVTLGFTGVAGADSLVFEIPAPQSPASAGRGDDPRKLGIALASMSIVPR
jgi:hypothetical protein